MRSSPSTPEHIIAVAVPVPGLGLLSYRVPDGRPRPPKGARVLVPLGGRKVAGVVVDPHGTAPESAELRDVLQVIDEAPFLPGAIVDLALWVGDYYASGPGEALAVAMPPAARDGTGDAFRTETVAELASDTSATEPPRGLKQRAAIELLRRESGITLQALVQRGVSTATMRSLASR